MHLEQFSFMHSGRRQAAEVAAAVAMAPGSEVGYWMMRAKVLDCQRSHRAIFKLLVDNLEPCAGSLIAERLAPIIMSEALNPRACKTCNGSGKEELKVTFEDGSRGKALAPCRACGGRGWHWIGERAVAGLMGLSRHQVRLGGYTETIREWAFILIVLEQEKSKQSKIG